ncbi:hypothetical protein FHS90_000511 [Rufibacter quisquiliarum]|uniref:Uncharacterized protein n=1 Tax=Rufibacter quisquiliarum TaxID=1549639 RepID=A0A839G8P5_9BACT|nr:hypothetical protein [Rufibacter quisquiliarum]
MQEKGVKTFIACLLYVFASNKASSVFGLFFRKQPKNVATSERLRQKFNR